MLRRGGKSEEEAVLPESRYAVGDDLLGVRSGLADYPP